MSIVVFDLTENSRDPLRYPDVKPVAIDGKHVSSVVQTDYEYMVDITVGGVTHRVVSNIALALADFSEAAKLAAGRAYHVVCSTSPGDMLSLDHAVKAITDNAQRQKAEANLNILMSNSQAWRNKFFPGG